MEFGITGRSKYYNLTPIGIGTSIVESLTSYIARLGSAHHTCTGAVVNLAITPLLNKYYLTRIAKAGGTGFYKSAHAVNGRGKMAEEFTQAIQVLTSRKDIKLLTMIQYQNVISDRGLLRSVRAWCPRCYQVMEDSGKVYEMLIWAIKPVVCCQLHQCYLVEKCPHCGCKQNVLSRTHKNGYCARCANWLGMTVSDIKRPTDMELYTAQEIGDLISHIPEAIPAIDSSGLLLSIKKMVENIGLPVIHEKTGIAKSSLTEWKQKESLPTLKNTVRLANLTGGSLYKFYLGRHQLPDIDVSSSKYNLITRQQSARVDLDGLSKKINAVIEKPINSVSITALAKKLGCDRGTIKKHFPEAYKIICSRYKAFVNSHAIQLLEEKNRLVKEAVENILINKEYPSRRRVESLVGKKALLRENLVQKLWNDLVHR